MSTKTLGNLIREAESLTGDERLQLAIHLLKKARKARAKPEPRRKWAELCGLAASPMVGEDAQDWVSSSRRESDDRRDQQWKPAE